MPWTVGEAKRKNSHIRTDQVRGGIHGSAYAPRDDD